MKAVCIKRRRVQNALIKTNASETIRKQPLVKAQTALRKQQNNKIWRKTIFNVQADGILTPYNVACGSGSMTVNSPSGSRPTLQCDTWLWNGMSMNSPGGSTLQCGRWLWDDMPLNSPKRPPCWNSTSGFDFGHITAVDMSFCTSLRNFIQIGPPSA